MNGDRYTILPFYLFLGVLFVVSCKVSLFGWTFFSAFTGVVRIGTLCVPVPEIDIFNNRIHKEHITQIKDLLWNFRFYSGT